MAADYIPGADGAFDAWQTNCITYATANAAALGLDPLIDIPPSIAARLWRVPPLHPAELHARSRRGHASRQPQDFFENSASAPALFRERTFGKLFARRDRAVERDGLSDDWGVKEVANQEWRVEIWTLIRGSLRAIRSVPKLASRSRPKPANIN